MNKTARKPSKKLKSEIGIAANQEEIALKKPSPFKESTQKGKNRIQKAFDRARNSLQEWIDKSKTMPPEIDTTKSNGDVEYLTDTVGVLDVLGRVFKVRKIRGTEEDIVTVFHKEWLNDTVIQAYAEFLLKSFGRKNKRGSIRML